MGRSHRRSGTSSCSFRSASSQNRSTKRLALREGSGWTVNLFLIVLAAGLMGAAGSGETPSDYLEYISEIKNQGMTDSAQRALHAVASIRLGTLVLSPRRDNTSGTIRIAYQTGTCPKPGANPEAIARWRANVEVEIEADVALLKKHADADHSGFVSSKEGSEFRELVEIGYIAAELMASEGPALDDLARVKRKTTAALQELIARYNELATLLNKVSKPMMPVVSKPGQDSK